MANAVARSAVADRRVDATAGAAADNAMALHASAAVANIVAWTILATRMSFLAV